MTSENSMHLERAAALLELRRPAEARQILEQLIASDPSDAAAMVLLARCRVQLGDDDGAIEWSRRAGAAAPDDLALLLDCSSVARTAGNASDAYAWAIRALSMAPTSVRALNLVSLAEVGLGMDGPAIGHAAAALEQAPDDLDLRVGYALALSASGRVADATVQYVQVLEQAPTHVYALNNLASLRLGVGDLRRSIRLFGRALAIDPRLQIAARNIDAAAVSGRRILASRVGQLFGQLARTALPRRCGRVIVEGANHNSIEPRAELRLASERANAAGRTTQRLLHNLRRCFLATT